ncbi:TPA: hypothetical protein OQ574_005046 [Salmonella enterica]|nr:hypothetical protein [Salmonella enterica]
MGSNRRGWTRADYEFLRDNYAHISVKQMAVILNRTPGAIRARLSLWGLLLEYRRVPGTGEAYRVVVCCSPRINIPDIDD